MFCSKCGSQTDENAKFCPVCGAAFADNTEAAPKEPPVQGQKVTENIYLCPDGVYRWIYEFAMMKNPTILFTIWKIFGGIIVGIWLFDIILMLFDGALTPDGVLGHSAVFAVILLGMGVLSFLAYLIVAASYGWKYIVLFEMDEQSVTHTQMEHQFRKAQALGWLTAAAGALAGNLTMTGAGISSAVHNSLKTEFAKVKSIKTRRGRQTIYVNEMLGKNQVYAELPDFDFVLSYINARIPSDAARK
ncbi:MAG: zinc ribbon domain-containing protein [Ruminiclostridium sp.]|nr:zinc ribbon domain-containing protein [Ruminiclostridium sp.]